MKSIAIAVVLIFALVLGSCSNKRDGKPKVLVFSKSMGYKHASISGGIAAIQKLGIENGFEVDTTKNGELFTEENLEKYSSIIFLSTTMNVLDAKQEAAFERYIQAGGGYVGVHAATDTEFDWGWYTKLVGAQFLSHPAGTIPLTIAKSIALSSNTVSFNEGLKTEGMQAVSFGGMDLFILQG